MTYEAPVIVVCGAARARAMVIGAVLPLGDVTDAAAGVAGTVARPKSDTAVLKATARRRVGDAGASDTTRLLRWRSFWAARSEADSMDLGPSPDLSAEYW
ncbi:hypothetical protein GCM10009835_06220 [Planosporangium flavigriseum]|uniref:Uncharacterized protein n=1 Tax=Planosporangium flavigriseum TaxID=373681 RepID=A0A8J3PLG0_9ACTN|nr:hypothetical protein Pfl04_28650 [Planosporangium flavigriseum]